MKTAIKFSAAAFVLGLVLVSSASADVVGLTSGNSTATILTDQLDDWNSWTVDGVEHLFSQQLYYRVGPTGGENSVTTLNQIFLSQTLTAATVQYSEGRFNVTQGYQLTGGAAGSGKATMLHTITVDNTTALPQDMHLFQYVDFDVDNATLTGTPDTVAIVGDLATQTGFLGTKVYILSSGTTGRQVSFYPDLLGLLQDFDPTTLDGTTGPVTGDLTYGLEWDFQLAAGGSVTLTLNEAVGQIPSVPEPASMLLLTIGGVAAILKRNRNRR